MTGLVAFIILEGISVTPPPTFTGGCPHSLILEL